MSKPRYYIEPYKAYFEVQSKLGILVSTTRTYWTEKIKEGELKWKK